MKIICPKCKAEHIIPIVYGYPSFQAVEEAEQGKIVLGGCVVDEGDPDKYCLECGYAWSINSLPAGEMKKVRYKVSENGPGFIDDMKTWVYEFYPTGKCVKYTYKGRNRSYVTKEEKQVTKQKMMAMYIKLHKFIQCDRLANILSGICDGCSYQIQVTYSDGRKEIKRGDVGMKTYEVAIERLISEVFDDYE